MTKWETVGGALIVAAGLSTAYFALKSFQLLIIVTIHVLSH